MPPDSKDNIGSVANASDETTPLLNGASSTPTTEIADSTRQHQPDDQSDSESSEQDEAEEVPLPKTQIFLLCYTAIVEPIAFFGIFPYINFMIEKVGNVDEKEVGFYSGLIESLFSATQMCVMILWGKASDRYGRKPILVISLLGSAVATTLFGMSQSLVQMVVARCFAGVFAGTVVTVRAMLSENSTKHTQAQAFSYFAFSRNIGLFIGPLLGGVLESPATKYGGIFEKITFFRHYPYALPGMVTSVIALSAAILVMLFVKETLHTHRGSKKDDEPPMSTWQLFNYPGVARVVLIYNYVMLLAFTYTAVSPVYFYEPIKLGGLGFTPVGIAVATAVAGLSQAIWLLVVFPRLHKRVGTGRVLFYCACAWPISFASCAVFNTLRRHGLDTVFWATAPPSLVVWSGVAMAFTAVQLTVNDIAPSHTTLGTLNSIVLAIQSGIRAVAPALATSIYAVGVKYQILSGHLFWLLIVILALGLSGVLRLLPAKVGGKPKQARNGPA